MYAVVGCSSCSALWMLEGRQETAQCPGCGRTHQYAKLKTFVETDEADHAREVRASMLASRGGYADAFAAVDSYGELDSQVERPVIDDDELLDSVGVDAEAAAAASESERGSRSRKEIVLAAVKESEEATADAIIAYATARGVPENYVDQALEKLVRTGELTESSGRYRRL